MSVAVHDLEAAIQFCHDALGLPVGDRRDISDQGVRVAYLRAGSTEIALMEPTDSGGPVGRFLQTRGDGLYHLAFEVEDIELAMRTLLARGAELLDQEPREGRQGRIAFVRPRGMQGLLIELWEPRGEEEVQGGAGES